MHKNGQVVQCAGCGVEVYRKASRLSRNPFCSRRCYKSNGTQTSVYMNRRGAEPERYWSRVLKTEGCWLWTGAKNAGGYGSFYAGERVNTTSGYAYMLHHNVALAAEQYVCHKCDNRLCVNPDHLFIGTANDNVQDKVAKGRQRGAVGEKNTKAKLCTSQVDIIRTGGEPTGILARRYSVTTSTIRAVRKGVIWR